MESPVVAAYAAHCGRRLEVYAVVVAAAALLLAASIRYTKCLPYYFLFFILYNVIHDHEHSRRR